MVDTCKSGTLYRGAVQLESYTANLQFRLQIVEIDMIPVTSSSQVPMVVHGTTKKAWERIGVSDHELFGH